MIWSIFMWSCVMVWAGGCLVVVNVVVWFSVGGSDVVVVNVAVWFSVGGG